MLLDRAIGSQTVPFLIAPKASAASFRTDIFYTQIRTQQTLTQTYHTSKQKKIKVT